MLVRHANLPCMRCVLYAVCGMFHRVHILEWLVPVCCRWLQLMGEAGSADRSELEARVRELEAERDALMEVSTHRLRFRSASRRSRASRFLLYDGHTPTSETH